MPKVKSIRWHSTYKQSRSRPSHWGVSIRDASQLFSAFSIQTTKYELQAAKQPIFPVWVSSLSAEYTASISEIGPEQQLGRLHSNFLINLSGHRMIGSNHPIKSLGQLYSRWGRRVEDSRQNQAPPFAADSVSYSDSWSHRMQAARTWAVFQLEPRSGKTKGWNKSTTRGH